MKPELLKFTASQFFRKNIPFTIFQVQNRPEVYPVGDVQLHTREFWKITYITEGSGILRINNRSYSFSPGFVWLSHPDDVTTWELSEPITLYNILFLQNFIEYYLQRLNKDHLFFSIFDPEYKLELSMNHELVHLLDANSKIYPLIRKMEHEFEQDNIDSEELLRLYLVELLIELSRLSVHSYARKRKEEIVHFINSYLEHHYTDPLNIDKIAEEIGYSRGYLFSFYKQKTGTTIGWNLQDIRLNHAKRLLRECDFPVEKICYRCGFSDISNFYRMFKKQTGESPAEFRKKQEPVTQQCRP